MHCTDELLGKEVAMQEEDMTAALSNVNAWWLLL
jgi:hypothetical protein